VIRNDDMDLQTFERLRPDLLALAYRMLGDAARAQDIVQEAWLRCHGRQERDEQVVSPKAYLLTVITRLCLNELKVGRKRAPIAGPELPEPVDLAASGMTQLEITEQISMAFMVLLSRLSAPERAALLLHDIFDYSHEEISELVERSVPSCRKLLERARAKINSGRKQVTASYSEHERILYAFLRAARTGDTSTLLALLAPDATLYTDGGPNGRREAGIRNLDAPLTGAQDVADFITKAAGRAGPRIVEQHVLNGRPALVFRRGGVAFSALLLDISDGRVQNVFFQGDLEKLRFLGPAQALS